LPFQEWIFHNGQPVRDNDNVICGAMTSTLEQRILA